MQIQGNAAFAGVVGGEKLAVVQLAVLAAPGRGLAQTIGMEDGFDFNHLRTVVSKIFGANRPNAIPGKV